MPFDLDALAFAFLYPNSVVKNATFYEVIAWVQGQMDGLSEFDQEATLPRYWQDLWEYIISKLGLGFSSKPEVDFLTTCLDDADACKKFYALLIEFQFSIGNKKYPELYYSESAWEKSF